MKNKLLRLAEIIQEHFPENLLSVFRSNAKLALDDRLALTDAAIAFHRRRAEQLWLQAGRKRTAAERQATAQAELAAFVFAYLTGDAEEYADSAKEALRSLGRRGEMDLVTSLYRS